MEHKTPVKEYPFQGADGERGYICSWAAGSRVAAALGLAVSRSSRVFKRPTAKGASSAAARALAASGDTVRSKSPFARLRHALLARKIAPLPDRGSSFQGIKETASFGYSIRLAPKATSAGFLVIAWNLLSDVTKMSLPYWIWLHIA